MNGWIDECGSKNKGNFGVLGKNLLVQRKKTREEKKLKKECNMFVYLLYMQERIQWWCLDSAEMLLSTKESTNLVRERGGAGNKKRCLDL